MATRAISHVMLVDDHALVRAGLRAMIHLIVDNCTVSEAGGYREAVGLLEAEPIDIAFIDLDLRSTQSGLDLLEFIRARELQTQVVMLSADDSPSMVLQCIDAGASGYLVKGEGDEHTIDEAIATVIAGGVHLPRTLLNRDPLARNPAQSATPPSIAAMPPRLREVLYYVCQGLTNKAIARRMGISEGTVRKDYVSELLRLFGASRRTELMIEVFQRGLQIPVPDGAGASVVKH